MVSITDNAILITTDVTVLSSSITHDVRLKALREVLDKREQKKIPTEELVQMAEFVLRNNFNLMVTLSSRSQKQLQELNATQYTLAYI